MRKIRNSNFEIRNVQSTLRASAVNIPDLLHHRDTCLPSDRQAEFTEVCFLSAYSCPVEYRAAIPQGERLSGEYSGWFYHLNDLNDLNVLNGLNKFLRLERLERIERFERLEPMVLR